MGKKLKIKMIEKGISGKQLSSDVGISQQYLSAILNDRAKNPSITLLKLISKILDVPVSYLLEE